MDDRELFGVKETCCLIHDRGNNVSDKHLSTMVIASTDQRDTQQSRVALSSKSSILINPTIHSGAISICTRNNAVGLISRVASILITVKIQVRVVVRASSSQVVCPAHAVSGSRTGVEDLVDVAAVVGSGAAGVAGQFCGCLVAVCG